MIYLLNIQFKRAVLPIGLIFILLTSCSSPEPSDGPPIPPTWANGASGPHQDYQKWWTKFNDSVLNELIDRALAKNPDLRQALARIDEARGMEKSGFASLLPQLSGNAAADRQRTSYFAPITGTDYSANIDARYELDLFGKNRAAHTAAVDELTAAHQDLAWVRLSLIAEIARTYTLWRTAEHQVDIAQKNQQSLNEALRLTERVFRAGGLSESDAEQARAAVDQSHVQTADAQKVAETYRLSLGPLTGLAPQELTPFLPSGSMPKLDLSIIADAPSDILTHRPDIAAAAARLSEATSMQESQAASIFPTISLSALFGLSKTVLVNPTTVWQLAGNAGVSLLDFGRIQGQIDAASARQRESFEDYRKTVLQAMQDVEAALVTLDKTHLELNAQRRAQTHAERTLALVEARRRAGDASRLSMLDSQRQLLTAEKATTDAQSQYTIAQIALIKAIGSY